MVTALLSLALNQPIRQAIAMTGEVSLTGKVHHHRPHHHRHPHHRFCVLVVLKRSF